MARKDARAPPVWTLCTVVMMPRNGIAARTPHASPSAVSARRVTVAERIRLLPTQKMRNSSSSENSIFRTSVQ